MLFPQKSCASRLCASSQESDYPLEKTMNSSPIKSEREALLVGKEVNIHTTHRIQRRRGRGYPRLTSTCQAFMKHDSARTQCPEDDGVRTSTGFHKNSNSSSQPSSGSLKPLQYQCVSISTLKGSAGEAHCKFFKSLCKDS
jgi:hypothetical protein